MVEPFSHQGNPKLVFGSGAVGGLPKLLNGASNVFAVTGGHFARSAAWTALEKNLAAEGVAVRRETVSGEPSPEIVDELTAAAREHGTATVIAIGGGSVLDAGKAAAAMLCHEGSVFDYLEGVGSRIPERKTVPVIAVPTTAGTGSEATKNAVISRRGTGGFKKSLRHDAFIPTAALIDPQLAVGCPPEVSLACGMDAFSQLLESFVSTGSTPVTDMMAREGIRHFAEGGRLFGDNRYGSAEEEHLRGELALAAYYSGLTLANAGLGAVHGLAGPLGAAADIPHGAACGLLAPPVFRRVAAGLRKEDPAGTLEKLAWTGRILSGAGKSRGDGAEMIDRLIHLLEERARKLPRLSDFGLTSEDLDVLAAESGNKNSPVNLGLGEMRSILEEVL